MIVLPWLLLLITITACVVLYLVTTKGMLTCYLDFNDTLFLQQSTGPNGKFIMCCNFTLLLHTFKGKPD